MSNHIQLNSTTISRKEKLFILFLSFLFISLFSGSSFIYSFHNPWVDANCIFTVGKSIFSGLVPYRDLLDHKGFLLHLINAIGSLISFRNFLGIYLIEILASFVFLYYSYKILLLFTDRKVLYYLPLLGLSIYGSRCFGFGASAEEFCLPFFSASIYICIRDLLEGKMLSIKNCFILGILASCVFWIKFNLCGLYVGIFLFYTIVLLRKKQIVLLGKDILSALLGFSFVSIFIIVYFAVNKSLLIMWDVYIFNNIFNYNISYNQSFGLKLIGLITNELNGLKFLALNPLLTILLLIAFWGLPFNRERKLSVFVLVSFLFSYIFVFPGSCIFYYPLALSAFAVFGIIKLKEWFERISLRFKIKVNILLAMTMLTYFILPPPIYLNDNINYFLNHKVFHWHEDPMLVISSFINNRQHNSTPPNIIEYGIMDIGIYTMCGVIPQCRNFCHLNLK